MKALTLISILLSTVYCSGQNGDYCGKKERLTIGEIKKKFPYDNTATINLVSFRHEYPVMQETDTIEVPAYEPEIPKTNGTVDLAKMFETRKLDKNMKEKIMDILVNYDNEDRPSEVAICYEPRNGIVFFDERNNVIGYVEICFECLRYKVEPNTMNVTHFCTEKFDALKAIFKKVGITYGTVSDQD